MAPAPMAGRRSCSRVATCPRSTTCSWPSVRAPHTSMPSTRLASARLSTGTTTAGQPSRLAASTAGSTPLTGRTRPSSANSPSSTVFSRRSHSDLVCADSTDSAKARSYTEPIFGSVAGESASVSRAIGQSLPQLVIAARTRSRDSCSAASASPTRCTPGRPEVMSASISTISSVEPTNRHRKRPAKRHQPTPCRWVISGVGCRPIRTPTTSMRTCRPTVVLRRQPQPGEPSQPAHLLRCDRLRDAAESVAGAGLHLDEHHGPRRVVGRDHVELAVPAPPVAGQHPQPQRHQVLDGELLSQRADLGTGHRSHADTVQFASDNRWPSAHAHPQPRTHPQPAQPQCFADVKKRVHVDMTDNSLQRVADKATDNDAFEYTARAGFAVSGVLHLLVAFIIDAPRVRLRRQRGSVRGLGHARPPTRRRSHALGRRRRAGRAGPVARRRSDRRLETRRGIWSAQRRHPGLEARQVARAGDRQLRDRLVRRALRDGQRPVERSAERRAVRPADAVPGGARHCSYSSAWGSRPWAVTTSTKAPRRSS